jgi:UDP-glucose 4-epimerase
MKVLITGASGFLGHYTAAALLSRGVHVLCVGRDISRLGMLGSRGAVIEVTDYSQESLEKLMSGVDAIVHLAARRILRGDDRSDLKPFIDPNINLTSTILSAAIIMGISNFVLASTRSVYSSRNMEPYSEKVAAIPANAYGLSKLIAEQYADMLVAGSSVRLTCLRFAALYGYGERDMGALMEFIYRARMKEKLVIRGNPLFPIEQLYVKDAVQAITVAIEPSQPGGIFNIGSGIAYTLVELAETVNSVFGNCGNLQIARDVEIPMREPIMDISRAKEILGWMPRYGLCTGLQDTLDGWGKIIQ